MALPAFLKEVEDTIIYDGDGELLFYLPERYFSDSKVSIAVIYGSYVSTIGVFDWAIMDKNGKVGKSHIFKYPTIFVCRPNRIEKVKNLSLNDTRPIDYMVLHFKNGDEVIHNVNIPMIVDNVEILFKLMVLVENKMPPTIPYDKLHEYFPENMELNTKGYGFNMQVFGFMISELCRDKNDPSKAFRHSKSFKDGNMTDYRQIAVKEIPKFISPYASLTSENWDESLMAAIQMSDEGNDTVSPMERVVTG